MLRENFNYCSYILPKVSRTFAINISFLKGELHESILSGYLICRIIDTIEDSPILSVEDKIKGIKNFLKTLKNDNDNDNDKSYQILSNKNISENTFENQLLKNSYHVLSLYQSLGSKYREAMFTPIEKMGNGMVKVLKRYQNSSVAILKDKEELREYCYYVAGTVGEMLSILFTIHGETSHRLEKHSVSFGLGLQMTNILKDFLIDSTRGVSYIPQSVLDNYSISYEDFISVKDKEKNKYILYEMINDTKNYLDSALIYSKSIKDKRIRLFCFLPLLMAIATLSQIKKNNFRGDYKNKISRLEVKKIILYTRIMGKSNYFMERYYEFLWGKN